MSISSLEVILTLITSSLDIVALFLTLFIWIVGVEVSSLSSPTVALDNTVIVYLVVPVL